MADESKSNFTTVIEQINRNEILLPDFQRNFVWKDEEQQKKIDSICTLQNADRKHFIITGKS